MAQNTYGTQPSSQPSVARRGRGGGGGGGGNRNRGGGGGKQRLPKGGLYKGKAGEAAGNQDPEAFIRRVLSESGALDYSGTPGGVWATDVMPQQLLEEYQDAQAKNQRLSVNDWMRQTYGAAYGGKRGNQFTAGTLPGYAQAEGGHYLSNTNQPGYAVDEAQRRGGYVAGGGNADFQRFYQTDFVPSLQAQFTAEQQADSKLDFDTWLKDRDIVGQARRQYLMRGANRRDPSSVAQAGRYSWYD